MMQINFISQAARRMLKKEELSASNTKAAVDSKSKPAVRSNLCPQPNAEGKARSPESTLNSCELTYERLWALVFI